MDEREATRLFAEGDITLKEYHELLVQIGTRRNRDLVSRKSDHSSMSSTKWS